MKTNKKFSQYKRFKFSSKILLFSLLLFLFNYNPLMSQEEIKEKFTLKLKSREFLPQAGIEKETLSELLSIITTEQSNPHVMVQFKKLPSRMDKERLKYKGLALLNYVGSNTWYASISNAEVLLFTDPEESKKEPILNSIRWMGEITPADKIAPLIREKRIGDWTRSPDGKVNLVISYFSDVDTGYVKSQLELLGAIILGGVPIVHNMTIFIDEDKIQDVATKDFIYWIETVPPLGGPELNRIRTHIQANLAQNPPLNLTGDGVIVGVLENSHAYINHPDLSTRAFKGDTDVNNYFSHATNMAGIIAGNGSQNNQYIGIATEAEIYTYDFEPGTATGTAVNNNINYTGDLQTAIGTHHIDIANNSWGTYGCYDFAYGIYNGVCPILDAAVRGDFGKPITIVFSAGNERDGYYDGSGTDNTSCITNTTAPFENYSKMNHPKASKNIITVGAIDSHNNRMSTYSSWGPVDDGRIKPDIVASGHHNGTINSNVTEPTTSNHMYLAPYYPTSGPNSGMYGYTGMTSAAAAATSGCLALLLEHYRNTLDTDLNPLPSTLKALLIHSAQDLDDNTTWYNPGPDYASGYGLLQIKDAVDIVDLVLFREGKVTTNRPDNYTFTLPANATSVKVTLVWDDPPAALNAVNVLVNDLDLKVFDPNNVQYYPWTLDPANPSNNAVKTTADQINNVEQVFVDQNLTSGIWRVVIDPNVLPQSPQRYSLVANYQLDGRIDIVQVLDRSGSMGGKASPIMPDTKIKKLRDASSQFVGIMKPNIGNRLGLVQFNQDVVSFPANSDDELSVLDGNKVSVLQGTTIPGIVHGGNTSIGDGLREALDQLLNASPPPEHDRAILLVTDGKENSLEMISDVQPDLITNDVTVYALGLGFGSGINESKLVNLVEATGGTYRITSDHLVFQKLFIETLAGAANMLVINDPIGTITRGAIIEVPVVISYDQDGVTFTVYWEGLNDAIALELITPSGYIISNALGHANIRYGDHSQYIFYQLDFPLVGDNADEWAGEWKMKLIGTDQIDENVNVRYATSAFAENGPKLNVVLDKLSNLTGDEIQIKAYLTRDGTPLSGATIDVFGDVPISGAGNILNEGKVNWDQLQQTIAINGDTLSKIDHKLQILSKEFGKEILQRGTSNFKLYDDGLHGDEAANDGIYANKFTETKIQGSYTFRFLASGIPAGEGRTSTSEWTKSFFNEVKIKDEHSDISFIQTNVTPHGTVNDLNIAMKDKFGNYIGPGHSVVVIVSGENTTRKIELEDNIDGTYSKEIIITKDETKTGKYVDIFIDGKKFTKIKPQIKRFSLSLHGGAAFPTGSFANDYSSGFNVMVDAGYHFSNQLSLVALFGYNDFKSKTTGIDDTYWINLSANLKYRILKKPLNPYLTGGLGYYIPKSGNSSFGANLGIGLDYDLNHFLTLEVGADYHSLFNQDLKFTQTHLGVIFRF